MIKNFNTKKYYLYLEKNNCICMVMMYTSLKAFYIYIYNNENYQKILLRIKSKSP